jgi:hypothetical protein
MDVWRKREYIRRAVPLDRQQGYNALQIVISEWRRATHRLDRGEGGGKQGGQKEGGEGGEKNAKAEKDGRGKDPGGEGSGD